MDTNLLDTKFSRMGARVKFVEFIRRNRWESQPTTVSLDIRTDRKGEFFEIRQNPETEFEIAVLDLQPTDRHLLLLVRAEEEKSKFLCGHDERHWFVAGIPESAPVGTVLQAKEALKPPAVLEAQAAKGLRSNRRNRRKNEAFLRQGEWFFLPMSGLVVDPKRVLHHEPISRGNGGKPHWVDYCYRTGGETVYVCSRYPNGLTEAEYQHVLSTNPRAKSLPWQVMKRNAGVYVKGRVRHADHATILLPCWHQVVMNTEGQSRAMRNVAFLD